MFNYIVVVPSLPRCGLRDRHATVGDSGVRGFGGSGTRELGAGSKGSGVRGFGGSGVRSAGVLARISAFGRLARMEGGPLWPPSRTHGLSRRSSLGAVFGLVRVGSGWFGFVRGFGGSGDVANCPLPTANRPLPTANCQLPPANSRLSSKKSIPHYLRLERT